MANKDFSDAPSTVSNSNEVEQTSARAALLADSGMVGKPVPPELANSIRELTPAQRLLIEEQVRSQREDLIRSPEQERPRFVPPGESVFFSFERKGTAFGLANESGNEPGGYSVDLGIFGAENIAPHPNAKGVAQGRKFAEAAADIQSTVIGIEAEVELPVVSKYLTHAAKNDLKATVGGVPSSDRPSMTEPASEATSNKVEQSNKVGSSQVLLDPNFKIDPSAKPDLSVRDENRFSASPDEHNVLDPRRNLPANWNADGRADYLLNSLADKAVRDTSAAQYVDGDGNFIADADFSSRSGDVKTRISASNPDEINSVKLLFLSLQTVDRKDFPQAVVDIANQFKFNADCMHALQLAQKEENPELSRATQLAIVEKQLQQYGLKYYDIALEQAKAVKGETKEQSLLEAKQNVEGILKKMRETSSSDLANDFSAPMAVSVEQGKGLTDAEKAAAGKLYASLFTRDEFLRCVGRAKYNTW